MRILVIEDEKMLADSIRAMLHAEGWEAEAAYDGAAGLEAVRRGSFDLVILDVMLPKINGYDIVRQLRRERLGVPVLMLTARSGLEDRVEGLDAGADYYLTKPFAVKELLACIHALLRRQSGQTDEAVFGNTRLDLMTAELVCGSRRLRLSSREFEVMRLLLRSGRCNLSKEQLLNTVWGFESDATENNVEAYVGFLRKKLRSIGSDVRIEAVRKLGYHLETSNDL